MIIIDGSYGEGGGQILRSSLTLSLLTGHPFRIENIRAGRAKPGLLRQHLTAVNAAQTISGGSVEGAQIGSPALTFFPGKVRSGSYHFAIGTAGSTTLVFQTVAPALLMQSESSRLVFEGGTHNPFAPPFDFCSNVFAKALSTMGGTIDLQLIRHGFYPAGGGRFEATIHPSKLAPLFMCERGAVQSITARAVVAHLPVHIAEKEVALLHDAFPEFAVENVIETVESAGPGNIVSLVVRSEHCTEQFFGFGEKNVSTGAVAQQCIEQARRYLASPAPVGEYLADQLLIPLAMAGKGVFCCSEISNHTKTNIDIINKFTSCTFECSRIADNNWNVTAP